MSTRRRVDPGASTRARERWQEERSGLDRQTLATAVRGALEDLAEHAPGHAVEVRVPPFGVVQCVPGPRHTRGTPPSVVEMDATTWLELVVGELAWGGALEAGRVRAVGERADLSRWLPLPDAPSPARTGTAAGQ